MNDDAVEHTTQRAKSNLRLLFWSQVSVKGTIIVTEVGDDAGATAADRNNKQVLFKNCVPLHYCISKIDNSQVDDGKYQDVAMLIRNLIE